MKMGKEMKIICVVATLFCLLLSGSIVLADDTKYYIGEKVKTKKDAGYSGRESIDKDDPHYGWDLGRFYITGYSSKTELDGNPVFLKTVGDEMSLHFELLQDIKKLNGDKNLSICEDTNGYDKYFGIEPTNFGRGTLIIQHTDYQNNKKEPVVYTDYLAALEKGADVTVRLLEEGDYEVTLDYEIRKEAIAVFGYTVVPKYGNYEIFFKFSVRNGNCMVYPFDVKTRGELTNSAYTENGFYLDFAKSHYLDIHIKREVYTDGTGGLSEDTRFNKPAKEGETFTDEGIYTITAYNGFTKQTTTKVIYVGTNNVMKAHVVNEYSFVQIQQLLDQGYTIADDGTFIDPKPTETFTPTPSSNEKLDGDESDKEKYEGNARKTSSANDDGGDAGKWIVVGMVVISIIVAVFVVVRKTRKKPQGAILSTVDFGNNSSAGSEGIGAAESEGTAE